MKITHLLIGAAALVAVTAAQAQTTVEITGATAFRVATLDSIFARFVASGAAFRFAHDRNTANSTPFNAATLAIFEGTFPGVTGTTIIRCRFNGSIEGLNALVNSPSADPLFLNPNVLTAITSAIGGNNSGLGLGSTTTPTQAAQAEIAFSDVSIQASPFSANPLQPASPQAGVVVFTMIANEGAPASLTNITSQNFRALLGTGVQPLSLFTGNLTETTPVYATGRNDGSGTRTAYLAESGYGISNVVNQYVAGVFSGNTITQIHRVPAAGLSASIPGSSASNASTLWGNSADGNGGYSSGSALRDDMGRTTATTTVLDADASELQSGTPIHLVTWLSIGDAGPARTAGAKILGYNGSILSDFAATGTVTAADDAKVQNGSYTAWSFQQMYLRNNLTGPAGDTNATNRTITIYNGIKNNLVLGALGIATGTMNVGRAVDGGLVIP